MLNINLIYCTSVNYAMSQNHAPIIRSLTIENREDIDLTNIKVNAKIDSIALASCTVIEMIPAGTTISVNDLQIKIDAKYLSELTEKVSSEIEIVIYRDDEEILVEKHPIDILPFDQWAGVSVLPEMLSSFVTPNHPIIAPILHRASSFLEAWTGSPSLDEYQSRNPDRVRKQMAAIYEAIAEQNIVYITPPASYELLGQRVRLCDALLSTKLGTCLDMALLYASCLEAIGINSLVVVIKGHAFAGGWLVDDTFSDTVNDDVSLLTKRLAEGINEVVVVETTCMNSGKNISFDSATKIAEDHLIDSTSFVLSVDIKRCRFASLRPLPQRVIDASGVTIIESEQKIRNNDSPQCVIQDTRTIEIGKTEVTKQRIWERKLLDLSLRNNLLNIRLTRSTLQLLSSNINLLEDALADGEEFAILEKPQDWYGDVMNFGVYQPINQADPIVELVRQELSHKRLRSYLTDRELSSSLTTLYRSSRSSLEENGANTLYLALGLLKWFETPNSERPRYAPILLLPVEIIRKSAAKGYVIRSREEEVMLNITLLEMLRQDFGINIGGLEVLPKDESGVDVKLVFNTIRKGIMNQKRWDVEEQALLGIFSFSKFIMWNDIHNNAEKLCENKIVKSLISGVVEWDSSNPSEFDLDNDFKPSDIALPISADSFQMEAVCSADRGESFILHGPPGTGKSQTITNIIANALYKGKRVLFVAEKMAALSVVQKRLSDIGLAPFCLELHSNKSKKSTILEQLRITTEIVKKVAPDNFDLESNRLHTLRDELSGYVNLLHNRQVAGISLYDAIYEYCKLEIVCDYKLSTSITLSLSKSKVTECRDVLEQLQNVLIHCGSVNNHPLKSLKLSLYSNSVKSEIREAFSTYSNNLKDLGDTYNEVDNLLGGKLNCDTFDDYYGLYEFLTTIKELEYISSALLKEQNIKTILSKLDEIISRGEKRDRLREEILLRNNNSILEIDASKLLTDWKQLEEKWFLPKCLAQNKLLKLLRGYSTNPKQIAKDNVKGLLTKIINYQTLDSYISDIGSTYAKYFGELWAKWDIMKKCADSTVMVFDKCIALTRDITLGVELSSCLADKLSQGVDTFNLLYGKTINGYVDIFNKISSQRTSLTEKYGAQVQSAKGWSDEDIITSDRIVNSIELLKDWCTWNNAKQSASNVGLSEFVEYVESNSINNIVDLFNCSLYRYIIDSIIDAEPMLANFNGKLFEEKINKFKELTLNFEELTKRELYARLAANIPSFAREASQSSEVGILQRNIRNRGRGTSIRKLFDSISTLLNRITPCMLMSPISVAQYIDAGSAKFDLVIFDEASQMPTCEAVGAIARANQVIVVGDPKQMPPTSFFSSSSVDEDNLDKEDLESILDDCLALSIPSRHLLWHYRSKHESLIAFSNSQYYENKLLTFPSPDDIKNKVTYQKIDGFYDKGKSRQNRAEADAIVSEVIARLQDPKLSALSIGIVTFSSVQQALIEDLLTEKFAQYPQLEELAYHCNEPIFIKNLENVQGDERDVILFSIGYGPDKDGNVSHNFGPLNRDGGWRRLNVAVSRARYEMKVFSTLQAEQIDLARTSSEGVAGLKAFLEYAQKGKNTFVVSSSSTHIRDLSLVNLIADKIRTKGYDVNINIGCSGYKIDLGVVNPANKSEYLLGVIFDGETYRDTKSCRDREMTQKSVLTMLGWHIHRVWSIDYLENPDKVVADIIAAIENATHNKEISTKVDLELPKSYSEVSTTTETISDSVEENDNAELADISQYQTQYMFYPIKYCGILADEFTYGQRDCTIMQQIKEVLNYEAPISRDQLCRRVLSMWGISRIGSRIDSHFTHIFSQLNLKSTGSGKGVFFWKEEQVPSEYMTYRVGYTTASDIAPEEVSVAVMEVLQNQISLSKEDLIRETARLFGYSRLGNIVEASMPRGITKAIERGFAREYDDRIMLV